MCAARCASCSAERMADGDAAPSKSSQSLAAIDVGAGEGHDEFRRRGGSIDRFAGAQPGQHAHAVLNRGSAVFRTHDLHRPVAVETIEYVRGRRDVHVVCAACDGTNRVSRTCLTGRSLLGNNVRLSRHRSARTTAAADPRYPEPGRPAVASQSASGECDEPRTACTPPTPTGLRNDARS